MCVCVCVREMGEGVRGREGDRVRVKESFERTVKIIELSREPNTKIKQLRN